MNGSRASREVPRDGKIYVAGGDTLIGAALLRTLRLHGYSNVIGTDDGPDLLLREQVNQFFESARPQYVFYAAGKLMGIGGNQRYPGTLMLDNLLAATHVIDAARLFNCTRLLFLASSCCYPKASPQPMKPEYLGTSPLEPTNEAYATAKLAGLRLCQAYTKQYGSDFLVAIPANPFGIGDHFDLEDSHVIPAILRKMHEAKEAGDSAVSIWGTGTAQREFIFGDDLAEACVFVMNNHVGPLPINLGSGHTVSIKQLAELARDVVGYQGELVFDATKPDGMPVKALDSAPLLALGWRPKRSLREAIALTYQWFLQVQQGDLSVERAAHG